MPGRLSPLVLIALVLSLYPGATPVEASDDSRNAATWYQRAIDAREDLTLDEWNILGDLRVEEAPTDEVRRIVRKGRHIIQFCRRGSTRQYCDYNLNYDEGFGLLLPHLGALRSISRLVRTEAMVRLHDGDSAGAAELFGVLYRMSEHFTDDRTLISSLVGQAVVHYNDYGIQVAIDRAAFQPADAARLLHDIKPLHSDDPFQVIDAVAMEQEMVVGWLDERYGQEDGGMAELMQEMAFQQLPPDEVAAFEEMSSEVFQEELTLYDEAMTRVGEIFTIPNEEDAQAAMDEFDKDIEAGEYGMIAGVVMPALSKMLDRVYEAREHIDERVELFTDLATGEKAPMDEADASYLYLEAIRLIRGLSPERIELITRLDADPPMQLEAASTEATLTDIAPVLEVLSQATTRRRCNFKHAQAYFALPLAQSYHDGMRDVFRVLHVAAILHLRAGHSSESATLLTQALTVVRHLSDDPQIMSAVIADAGFARTDRLIRDGIEARRLDDTVLDPLHVEVRRIGRGDTFGYATALSEGRELAQSMIMYAMREIDQDAVPRQPIIDIISRLNADQLCFHMSLRDALERAGDPSKGISDEALARLSDVLPTERVIGVRRLTSRLAPLIAAHDYSFLLDPQLPSIADLEQRRRGGASRVRSLTRLLAELVKDDTSEPAMTDSSSDSDG